MQITNYLNIYETQYSLKKIDRNKLTQINLIGYTYSKTTTNSLMIFDHQLLIF